MDGWIILDKPESVFSRKCSAKIAKMFNEKKFGHLGTLDPMATGVLPIALGNATKTIPFLEAQSNDETKEYIFSMRFGYETDSLDVTGNILKTTDIIPTENAIKSILGDFLGKSMQIPPLFSAVHIDGKRAYDIARKGQQIELPAREINISVLEYIGKIDESYTFKVVCSRGTYVRSLGRDIAYKVNSLATVDMIRRTKTNCFDIENAVKLDFLENMFNNNTDIKKFLMPVDFGLGDIPVHNLSDESTNLYKNGGFIKTVAPDGIVRVYNKDNFVGIGVIKDNLLRPRRTI